MRIKRISRDSDFSNHVTQKLTRLPWAPEGRLLTIGYASGKIPSIPANLLLVKNIAAMGFNLGHFFGWSPGGKREDYIEILDQFVAGVLQLHNQGKIHPEIGKRFPLTGFTAALDAVLDRQVMGKCVVEMGPDDY